MRIKYLKQKFNQKSFRAVCLCAVIGIMALPIGITQQAHAAGNPLAGSTFYVNSDENYAAAQAAAWRLSRPSDAASMDRIASQSKAFWKGNWTPSSQQTAADYVNRAQAAAKIGVLVAYNIPGRDCGSYSAGGATSYSNYKTWIDGMSAGIAGRRTIVVLEPDALAQLDCMSADGQAARLDALSYALTKLKAGGALVYLDIGNPGWLSSAQAATRLQQANISAADGFSLDISNFYTTNQTTTYGTDISNRLGGKHFIIDTSRNGLGSNGQWCNPTGRALGTNPTSSTASPLIDAYLWIKGPGESDGACK